MNEYKAGFAKKKKKEGFVDKRRFKRKINKEEVLEINLISELALFEVQDISNVANQLKKVKNFCHLNIKLLIVVYLYFCKMKKNIGNVVLNFDNDFKEIIKDVKKKGIFPKLEGELRIYKFRQDFIMYLILLYNINPYKDMENENFVLEEKEDEEEESELGKTIEDDYSIVNNGQGALYPEENED